MVWETVQGSGSGAKAAEMYEDVVKPALKKRFPGRASHMILEDNDPTGNLSKKGVKAKQGCKLKVFTIPKRSPDLNVLDYAIWARVESLLRLQERRMASTKRETRAQFERRLNRTALSLPPSVINRMVANMRVRVQRLYKAKGGLFEEGGRSKRRPS